MKILVAEDDETYSVLYNRMLTKWGFSFDLVGDGKEAVERAVENEGKYDICLMDIDMPFMNGYEATKLIRRKTRYFPILAVTGNIAIKDKYFECGMDDYLKKPWNISDLQEKIAELTIKATKLDVREDKITITKEMPMDQEHAIELKKLKKQNLIKMRIDGPEQHEVIAHENTPNKISHDFNQKKYLMTEFLNRDPDRPTLCDLYRGGRNCIIETFLDEDDYTKRLASEDTEMSKYTKKIYKPEEE